MLSSNKIDGEYFSLPVFKLLGVDTVSHLIHFCTNVKSMQTKKMGMTIRKDI